MITQHALPLVQDPFGNYVVQYVLGLDDAAYYDGLIRRFIEPIRELSVQKFSSNVIEKVVYIYTSQEKAHGYSYIIAVHSSCGQRDEKAADCWHYRSSQHGEVFARFLCKLRDTNLLGLC